MAGSGLDFSGITIPFSAGDLLSAGVALLGVVSAFVLLGLAFKVVPKLIGLVVGAFRQGAGNR